MFHRHQPRRSKREQKLAGALLSVETAPSVTRASSRAGLGRLRFKVRRPLKDSGPLSGVHAYGLADTSMTSDPAGQKHLSNCGRSQPPVGTLVTLSQATVPRVTTPATSVRPQLFDTQRPERF